MEKELIRIFLGVLATLITALLTAGVLSIFRLRRDVDELKTTTGPVVTWWLKTSMDALKLATNPTSERLAELADRYIATVKGEKAKTPLNAKEKQELIDGLRDVMNDGSQFAHKRQSASMSLRFIETREGLSSRPQRDRQVAGIERQY